MLFDSGEEIVVPAPSPSHALSPISSPMQSPNLAPITPAKKQHSIDSPSPAPMLASSPSETRNTLLAPTPAAQPSLSPSNAPASLLGNLESPQGAFTPSIKKARGYLELSLAPGPAPEVLTRQDDKEKTAQEGHRTLSNGVIIALVVTGVLAVILGSFLCCLRRCGRKSQISLRVTPKQPDANAQAISMQASSSRACIGNDQTSNAVSEIIENSQPAESTRELNTEQTAASSQINLTSDNPSPQHLPANLATSTPAVQGTDIWSEIDIVSQQERNTSGQSEQSETEIRHANQEDVGPSPQEERAQTNVPNGKLAAMAALLSQSWNSVSWWPNPLRGSPTPTQPANNTAVQARHRRRGSHIRPFAGTLPLCSIIASWAHNECSPVLNVWEPDCYLNL